MKCFPCLLLLALIAVKEGCTKSWQEPDNFTTCRVIPSSVVEGQQVVIICEFNRDVSSEDFNVHLYKTPVGKRGQGEPEDILILIFTKWSNDPTPTYEYYEEGYRIIGDVSTHMMVTIDSVTMEKAGNYSCQLTHVKGKDLRYCSLEVTAKQHITSCDVQPVPVGQNASIICHFNIDLLRGHRMFRLEKKTQYGVFLGAPVECTRLKGNFQTCSSPDNDCVDLADRQKSITCDYDPKQYYVDISAVTPSTVTVAVLNVSQQSGGVYVCKPVPAVHPNLSRCQLNVSERTTVPSSSTTSYSTTTTSTTSTNQSGFPSVSYQPDSSGVVNSLLPLTVLTFVLLLIVVALLGGCLLYKYRQRVSKYIRRLGAAPEKPEENADVDDPLIDKPDATILIVGPQGSGKSSLANTITGGDNFPVGYSTTPIFATRKPKQAVVTRNGKRIKVVDTPYIFGPADNEKYQKQQVSQWKAMAASGTCGILLAVSGNSEFDIERCQDYYRLRNLWGDEDFCRRLIVVFTFADSRRVLHPNTSLEVQLQTAAGPLRRILREAQNYYVEVNNRASPVDHRSVVTQIVDLVEKRATEDMSPDQSQAATCPDPQGDVSQNEPLLKHHGPDTSTQGQTFTQTVGAASSMTPVCISQPSAQCQSQSQTPPPTAMSATNTATATTSPGCSEELPLVPMSLGGDDDKHE